MYGCVFVVGYLLSMTVSAWERQRFVEAEVAGNGVASLLRLGLSDELDWLQRDLAAAGPPLEAARAKSKQADEAFGDVRAQIVSAHAAGREHQGAVRHHAGRRAGDPLSDSRERRALAQDRESVEIAGFAQSKERPTRTRPPRRHPRPPPARRGQETLRGRDRIDSK